MKTTRQIEMAAPINLLPVMASVVFMNGCKHQIRGVEVKYIDCEDYRFCYLCRGKPGSQPSILMLHEFLFNKDMWLKTIKFFPKDIHVVCIDMPAHGDATRLLLESYTALDQAKRIHQLVERIGLNENPFHLVGISSGGMVAGVYAAQYPSEVHALSLLCPAGLRYSTDHGYIKYLKEQIQFARACDNLSDFLTVDWEKDLHMITKADMQLLMKYGEEWRPHKFYFAKYFLDSTNMKSRYSLHDNMSQIKAPTQIIWGKNDKVIDPSAAELLANAIPDSQTHILEECGHFIILERPKKSAELLLEFYTSVCSTTQNKKLP
ncbi:monoacylglycerol lipase ABHD6-like [Tiliqua scincoides]|uniref:monoacylglycerol lipase ABHD6-like n=1 Tax=Tiliqua scincoides TaxID=71010 RepID=UPI0034637745